MADSSNTQYLPISQANLDANFSRKLGHVGCTAAILYAVAAGLDPVLQAAVRSLAHDIWSGVQEVESLQNARLHFVESEKTSITETVPAGLADLDMNELLVLFDYCDRIKDLSTEFVNQPRTTGRASDLIDAMSTPSLKLHSDIVTEALGRHCTDEREIRSRGHILVRRAVMMHEHEQVIAEAAKAISSARQPTV